MASVCMALDLALDLAVLETAPVHVKKIPSCAPSTTRRGNAEKKNRRRCE